MNTNLNENLRKLTNSELIAAYKEFKTDEFTSRGISEDDIANTISAYAAEFRRRDIPITAEKER